jgi:hypothetical protein
MKLLLGLLCASTCLWGQFRHLATTSDGSRVYFASPLPLTGVKADGRSRIFMWGQDGVRLFAQQDGASLDWPSASGDGRVVAFSSVINGRTQGSLAADTGKTFWTAAGRASISRSARFAVFVPDGDDAKVSILDLSGILPTSSADAARGASIASDGTAVLRGADDVRVVRTEGASRYSTDGPPEAAAIDDDGCTVVYAVQGRIVVLDPRDGTETLVAEESAQPGLTDDGRMMLYLRRDESGAMQVWINGGQLSRVASGIAEAVLSGDGSVVYAVTGENRLLKLDTTTGEATDLTPLILATIPPPTAEGATIVSFSNDPAWSPVSGGPVTLSWVTQNTSSVVITGLGAPAGPLPPSGSAVVRPTTNTTYTLIAYGNNGAAVSTVLYIFVR